MLREGSSASWGSVTSLLATYEVRGRPWGASHGGIFLIDLEARSVRHMLEWAQAAEDLRDRGTGSGAARNCSRRETGLHRIE